MGKNGKNKYREAFLRLIERYQEAFGSEMTKQELHDWHLVMIACDQVVSPNKTARIRAQAKQEFIVSIENFLRNIK